MVWEVALLVGLAAIFVVLKVLQSETERKRRLDRAQRDLRIKAASGGFAPKKWDEPESGEEEPDAGDDEQESQEEDDGPEPSEESEEKEKVD